jgi:hypothetical protein
MASSLAIDGGSNAVALDAVGNPLSIDQRGRSRYFDDGVVDDEEYVIDIGAFERSLPKVSNVIIGSTAANPYGTNPPYVFNNVAGTEEQLQTVPVGTANVISVEFTEDVVIPLAMQSDVSNILVAVNQIATLPSATFGYDSSTHTATWTLASRLPSAQYVLQLDSSIVNSAGTALDGEWTNPTEFRLVAFRHLGPSQFTSTFPSGDNHESGDFSFVFTILNGDANRDMAVNIGDANDILPNLGMSSAQWEQGDFNGNGQVDVSDYNIDFTPNYGFQWHELLIIGDYDGDFDIDMDQDDIDIFEDLYINADSDADVDADGDVDTVDYDLFYERLGLGIELSVV